MACVRIISDVDWFVGLSETDEVRHDDAVTCVEQYRDHLAIEITPGRLSVEQQHWSSVTRSFIEVMHPQMSTLGVGDVGKVW
jgi:hypothetical protein